MKKDDYMLRIILNFIPTMIFLVFFLSLYREQKEYENYYKTSCYIADTTYPINISESDNGNGQYWVSCSCGKRCRSASPCLSLYTDENDLYMLRSYGDKKNGCTFYENPCIGNENPLIVFDKMHRYADMGRNYQNSTVECYKRKKGPDTNFVYLNLKDVSKSLYVISGIFGFFLLVNVYLVFHLFFYNDDKKKVIITHQSFPMKV